MNLNKFKFYFINFILIIFFSTSVSAKKVPDSFADLAEKLMPSVVNISTTQTITGSVNPFPFQFPPGSPFEELFKDFNSQTERQVSSLGSGFIIDAKGIVITNNHVIQNAEEIIIKISGRKEFKAKVLGNDPLSDVAVIEIISEELGYIGTLCVEFFIDKKDNLYVNEIAPRVHNSGHLTINSHNISQFENHVRAVCALEKKETKKLFNAKMINLIGDDILVYRDKKYSNDEFFFDYLKKEIKPKRKMGHLTVIKKII